MLDPLEEFRHRKDWMVSIVKGICCKFLVIEDDIYCMQRGKLEQIV